MGFSFVCKIAEQFILQSVVVVVIGCSSYLTNNTQEKRNQEIFPIVNYLWFSFHMMFGKVLCFFYSICEKFTFFLIENLKRFIVKEKRKFAPWGQFQLLYTFLTKYISYITGRESYKYIYEIILFLFSSNIDQQ